MTNTVIREILKTKTVGIAGCGGLGSNCAVALARAGVGKLILADHDVIELSNLNRQYYFLDQVGSFKVEALRENILRIDPDIKLETYVKKLTPADIIDIFSECDVIVEAFDKAEEKAMIIEIVLDKMPGHRMISGSGMAGFGRSELIHVRDEGDLRICGDELSEVSDELPVLAPRVGIVANLQANEVLDILLTNNK